MRDCNVLIIGICNFDIVCNLSIAIWDFSALSGKLNHFYLNQLELTLTFPWTEGFFSCINRIIFLYVFF